jgi:hypothetical protein
MIFVMICLSHFSLSSIRQSECIVYSVLRNKFGKGKSCIGGRAYLLIEIIFVMPLRIRHQYLSEEDGNLDV